MLTLFKIAWRNVLRHKRRTFLSGLAIGLGLASMILFDALMVGMEENMIRSATETFTGQGQVHNAEFTKTYQVEDVIAGADDIMTSLRREPLVNAVAPRVLSHGMITSSANVNSVMVYGIEPEAEATISKLKNVVEKGLFLQAAEEGKALLGRRLADSLEVDIGDRIVITAAQAGTGELSQELFRVGGIFFFNMKLLDENMVFINLGPAKRMLNINGLHEIAINFGDIKISGDSSLELWQRYSRDGNIARGWRDLFPELSSVLELSWFGIWIMALILFGIVSLGIMNTLFMSLYERMFEFGVLRAIGTRPARMALIILFEAAALSLISIVIGLVLGIAFTYWLSVTGIDYENIEFAGVAFTELIYPVLELSQLLVYPAWLFVFTLLVGLYPAIYAARLTPARAMRKSF